jgi:hypothetical protein
MHLISPVRLYLVMTRVLLSGEGEGEEVVWLMILG